MKLFALNVIKKIICKTSAQPKSYCEEIEYFELDNYEKILANESLFKNDCESNDTPIAIMRCLLTAKLNSEPSQRLFLDDNKM